MKSYIHMTVYTAEKQAIFRLRLHSIHGELCNVFKLMFQSINQDWNTDVNYNPVNSPKK